ncbi:tripartite motif-containing protein 16-like [Poeciliopsis prolifica]|uniref:tripartite motif-containing protein 16-like n=1 Tax=Poeciliopsis prolifica TaxID=188132 RepID=UPI0024143EAD|nr:tripartite motif-containing protein 16-like [Poeciliopsis prolifica]
MAQGIQLERERFCCSLCTNLLRDPMTIPCGHNFCMTCINKHLDNEAPSGIYRCPQCSEFFISRPTLVKNNVIVLVVEQLRKTEVQPEVPALYRDTDSTNVACDFCSERKVKAVKSCLQCMASYCATHLQPHNEVPPLRKHRLVEPTASLEESICPVHQEVMKMFCQTDQRCICYLCAKDGHKGHNKVSMSAERTERQKELQAIQQKIQLRIAEKTKDVKTCQQAEYAVSHAADGALSTTELVFTKLIERIEKKLSLMKEKMNYQQNIELDVFRKVRNKVEDEIMELKRKDIELDQLSHTEDHVHFLLKYPSLSRLSVPKEQPSIRIRRQRYFDRVPATVSEAKMRLYKVLDEECEKILLAITNSTALPKMPEPKPEENIRKPKPNFYNTVEISRPAQRQTTTQFMQAKLLQNLDSTTPSRPSYLKPQLPEPSGNLGLPRQKLEDLPSSEYFTDNQATFEPTRNSFPERGDDNPDVIPLIDRPISPGSGIGNVLKTRGNFLEHACQITLNPDTAFSKLLLTKENRKVTFVSEEQDYPNHPERFAYTWQVLSQQSLSGRCYLEVQRSGKGVMVAMAYKGISRTGTFSDCMFGQNSISWGLDCFKNSCEFRHNKNKTPIPGTWSSRVGVYLDYKAGILSFYSVSETMTLLHRIQTTFTEPLYVGLWLSDGATAEICKLV